MSEVCCEKRDPNESQNEIPGLVDQVEREAKLLSEDLDALAEKLTRVTRAEQDCPQATAESPQAYTSLGQQIDQIREALITQKVAVRSLLSRLEV